MNSSGADGTDGTVVSPPASATISMVHATVSTHCMLYGIAYTPLVLQAIANQPQAATWVSVSM